MEDDCYYYYRWICHLVDLMIAELEEKLGKKFVRNEELTRGAVEHCKAMIQCGGCYQSPVSLRGSALAEAVDGIITFYQEQFIEQAVKTMARGLISSQEYYSDLRSHPVIGANIAVKERQSGEVAIYTTIRLKK